MTCKEEYSLHWSFYTDYKEEYEVLLCAFVLRQLYVVLLFFPLVHITVFFLLFEWKEKKEFLFCK